MPKPARVLLFARSETLDRRQIVAKPIAGTLAAQRWKR